MLTNIHHNFVFDDFKGSIAFTQNLIDSINGENWKTVSRKDLRSS